MDLMRVGSSGLLWPAGEPIWCKISPAVSGCKHGHLQPGRPAVREPPAAFDGLTQFRPAAEPYLYLIDEAGDLVMLDLSDPNQPVEVGRYKAPADLTGVTVGMTTLLRSATPGCRCFGQRLGDVQDIRRKLNLSQAAFAGLMGVSLRTVQDWNKDGANQVDRQSPCLESPNNTRQSLWS